MQFTSEQEHFISTYLSAVHNGNAAVFAGAGLSKDSGMVDWRELLAPVAKRLGLKIEKESDLVALAQFAVNERGQNRQEIDQLILDDIGIHAVPNRKHLALSRLPINTYWTINYDKLIEDALKTQGKSFDTKSHADQFSVSRSRRDAVVYKMHGDIDDPSKVVFIRDDYEGYHIKRRPFIDALVGDLLHKRFLFVGLSFEDPNLNFVLGRIRAQYGGGGGEHFCLMREVTQGNDTTEDFRLKQLRQQLVAKDLFRFNITVVFVKEYAEIDELLEEIERRYRRTSVFISGSADETSPWQRDQVESFVKQLAGALVGKGCRIVTGFGRGIGPYVISGALENVYRKKLDFDQALVVRPFPSPEEQT